MTRRKQHKGPEPSEIKLTLPDVFLDYIDWILKYRRYYLNHAIKDKNEKHRHQRFKEELALVKDILSHIKMSGMQLDCISSKLTLEPARGDEIRDLQNLPSNDKWQRNNR